MFSGIPSIHSTLANYLRVYFAYVKRTWLLLTLTEQRNYQITVPDCFVNSFDWLLGLGLFLQIAS